MPQPFGTTSAEFIRNVILLAFAHDWPHNAFHVNIPYIYSVAPFASVQSIGEELSILEIFCTAILVRFQPLLSEPNCHITSGFLRNSWLQYPSFLSLVGFGHFPFYIQAAFTIPEPAATPFWEIFWNLQHYLISGN